MKKKDKGHTRIGNGYLRKGSPVKGNRLLVLIYLESRANKSRRCWPSIETIAEDLDLGSRTVKRAISDLEAIGKILRFRERDPRGQWERTIYEVADLRQDPGATVAHGPGATMAHGPGAKSRGQVQGPQWPTNKPQEKKTQRNNPQESPAGIALGAGESRKFEPAKDVPGWGAFQASAKRSGITGGQIGEQLTNGIPPAFLLGYLLEFLRKRPKIRKTPGAWLADKCKRKRAPAAVDYDKAKALLRPYVDRVALPGMRFGDLLPASEREESLAEKKRKAIERLEADLPRERKAIG